MGICTHTSSRSTRTPTRMMNTIGIPTALLGTGASRTLTPMFICRSSMRTRTIPTCITGTRISGHWYYCTDPAGYYPQVRNCAEGWLLVVPDDHASAVALQSKELNNAEQFAKANGCRAPVAKMNLAVSGGANFEAFAVACESEGSMLVRCDKGQC